MKKKWENIIYIVLYTQVKTLEKLMLYDYALNKKVKVYNTFILFARRARVHNELQFLVCISLIRIAKVTKRKKTH